MGCTEVHQQESLPDSTVPGAGKAESASPSVSSRLVPRGRTGVSPKKGRLSSLLEFSDVTASEESLPGYFYPKKAS